MITIKSKVKQDTDKVAVNGTIDKRPVESSSNKWPKDGASVDHSTKNGSFSKDDYRSNKSTGSYYKGNRVLMKNRSYSSEHGYTPRKYFDDTSKKRDDSYDSRSMYYHNYRNGK